MEMMMSAAAQAQAATSQLPPGFRFHPTDEELILHYLRNRAASSPCPVPIIADVDIYKFDPWDLPAKALYGDGEFYFFSPRDRKYPNGIRPNRAAGSGYWKATGTDKPIHDSATGESVGVKKALVFYKGRPPRGTKTNWIMHEYRLAAAGNNALAAAYRPPSKFRNVSMRLDDWVLCRIYKKSGQASPMVPPLADYEHLDHDNSSSGGGGGFDGICGGAFYAPTTSGGGATSTTTASSGASFMQHLQPPPPALLPKIPSISELFDEYALAQLFDTAAPPVDQDPVAVHPSLNQLLTVGDCGGAGLSDLTTIYSSSQSPVTAGGKRNPSTMMGPDEPPAKRLINGSCFDAPSQPASGLPAASSVLGGLSHHMLSQF